MALVTILQYEHFTIANGTFDLYLDTGSVTKNMILVIALATKTSKTRIDLADANKR